jgi:hypothetical protein
MKGHILSIAHIVVDCDVIELAKLCPQKDGKARTACLFCHFDALTHRQLLQFYDELTAHSQTRGLFYATFIRVSQEHDTQGSRRFN